MTENDIEKLGFDLVKSYPHDNWYTNRFQKGVLQVEFTYLSDNDELATVDLTIEEVVGMKFTLHELNELNLILNQ